MPGYSEREIWIAAIGIVVLDLAVFMIPIVPLVAAWVLITRPPWFKQFIDDVYDEA